MAKFIAGSMAKVQSTYSSAASASGAVDLPRTWRAAPRPSRKADNASQHAKLEVVLAEMVHIVEELVGQVLTLDQPLMEVPMFPSRI